MGIDADLPRLLNDLISLCHDRLLGHGGYPDYGDYGDYSDPRHIYRSILPFRSPLSPVLAYYNELSDPIRVLRVDRRRINPLHIPLNVSLRSNDAPSDEDRSAILVACAALSDDGHRVALGFCDGVVEVVDAELGVRVSRFADGPPSPPVWLLFTGGGSRLVTENSEGDVCILEDAMLHQRRFALRLDRAEKVMASLSHNASMIVRVVQRLGTEWHENASIIHISTGSLVVNALATPSLDRPPDPDNDGLRSPLHRSLGFSPDGQYVAAFDKQQGFIWSSASLQVVAQYSIGAPSIWFLNTNHRLIPPFEFPDPTRIALAYEPSGIIPSSSHVLFTLRRGSAPALEGDSSWGDLLRQPLMEMISQAAGTVPLLSTWGGIWFRGHVIFVIPTGYHDPKSCSARLPSPRQIIDSTEASFRDVVLPASRDGTRILVCDEEGFPVVVDISGVVTGDFAL